jgi:hypothetical protein
MAHVDDHQQAATTGQRQDVGQLIREIVTAVISIVIAMLALWMLCKTFYFASQAGAEFDEKAFSREKDILLLALGFLGTVTGYYLGRVPAEKQADAARDAADKATQSENRTKQQVRTGLDQIVQQQNALGGGAPNPVVQQLINLRSSI